MSRIILQPTATAQWQTLVKEAESSSRLLLSEDLESYLVFLLIRFTNEPEVAKSVLALEFLQSAETTGEKHRQVLREVGDKCLLFAGLFPGRAQRRRVRISYFVQLGQNAYATLANYCQQNLAGLYKALGQDFVLLMDVLHVVRELSSETEPLTPLQAEELWQDTASPHALSVLRRYTKAIPVQIQDSTAKNLQH